LAGSCTALEHGIFTYTFNIDTFTYNGQTDPAAQLIVELADPKPGFYV
jgi:hypothetical protein